MLVDSHCHLEFSDFETNFDDILHNAKANSVETMVTIGTKLSTFHKTLKVAAKTNNIFCTLGIHPNNSAQEIECPSKYLIALSHHPKIIGFGETGLDYHYEYTSKEVQTKSFINHIIAAQETGLPLIVHTRDADEDTVQILKDHQQIKKFKCLIHCFTSSRWLAEECLKFGAYISISGIVTFKSAKEIQEVTRDLPLDRILIETDSPYLAPMPHRGKRNEPAFVKHTAEYIADLKNLTLEEIATATTNNFYELFNRAAR